ncbi:MAG: TlpA disulfide reductase family protein [Propionicimonas sp.]
MTGSRRRARTALGGWLALGLLLPGCAGMLPGVGGQRPTAATVTPVAPAPATTAAAPEPSPTASDLVAARRAAGIEDCPPSSDAPAVPGGLPDVTLECLGGGSSVRLAGLRGPLMVNLWAQWCGPCRAEAAHLAAFARIQKSVRVLGIDYSDPQPELAIEFAQLTAMTYPHLADEEHVLKAPLAVAGIPYTLLIDKSGRIVARHPGAFSSFEEVQQWVEQGLGG